MLKRLLLLTLLLAVPSITKAQGTGTPNQLRVKTDANFSLVASGAVQTGTLTNCLFSNCRLAVDSSGNLQVVIVGGTVSSPIFAPTQTDCTVVSYSFTGRTTTGLNSHAANTWNLCGGGTLGLSGNTTAVTSSLPFAVPLGSTTATGFNFGTAGTGAWSQTNQINFSIADNARLSIEAGDIRTASNNRFSFASTAVSTGVTDVSIGRGGAGILTLFGTTPTWQFGGTTSSFPAIKRNGSNIDIRVADDSAYAGFTAAFISGNTSIRNAGNNTIFAAAPTVTSAGTSPSIPSNNGTAAFTVNVGTGGTATTIVLAMPASTVGWHCFAENITATAANRANQRVVLQASTTTSVTLQNQTISTGAALAFTASDIVSVGCLAR